MTMLLATLPLLVAIFMLAVLQRSGLQSGVATMLAAVLLVLLAPLFHLSIFQTAIALGTGVGTSLTVLYVLLPALLLYQVQRATGSIDILAQGISRLCPDPDVQLLLLILGIAPFIESVSGFGVGTVVIIPMLLALGMDSLQAAVLGLCGQIAVPWGALAVGVVLGAQLTGLNLNVLGAQTALIAAPVPFCFALFALYLAGRRNVTRKDRLSASSETNQPDQQDALNRSLPQSQDTRHPIRRLWLIALCASILLVAGEWFFSLFISVELAGAFASIPVIGLLIAWGRITRKGVIHHAPVASSIESQSNEGVIHHAPTAFFFAVMPYIILTLLLLLSRFVEPLSHWLQITGVLSIPAINLQFPLLYNPGFYIFLSVIVIVLLTRMKLEKLWDVLLRTMRQFTPGAVAIASFLAASQVMKAGGMIDVLGVAAASLGSGYRWIAPWLAALGGWLTGSNAGANALFAQLQHTTSLRAHLPVHWVMAAQNGAGSIVTMISPARVVLATSTVGIIGKEGKVLRQLVPSVLFAIVLIMFALVFII